MQRGNELSISAELVDARDDRQLWGEQYNRKLADILAVQEDISREISEKLRLRLSGEEKARVTKRYTENAEAYQAYLKGRYHWGKNSEENFKNSEENFKKAIKHFNDAIQLDPVYAPAYAGMADCYYELATLDFLSPTEAFPKAKAAAIKALETDATLAEAHSALAVTSWAYDWDWAGAEREFKRAIELNPGSAIAHHRYDLPLMTMGRFDEGLAEGRRAQELDPLSPIVNYQLAFCFTLARRYEESIVWYKKTLDLDPNAVEALMELAQTYAFMRMYSEAVTEHEKNRKDPAEDQLLAGSLGWVYAVSGRRDQARKIIGKFKELSARRYVDAYMVAEIYAGLGDKDQAFRWLKKGYEERSTSMTYLKVDPLLESLHSDPRFEDLVRRVGLWP